VAEWEYRKLSLNQHPPQGDELDMLNAAGADGWELIGITSNNIAYLKRKVEEVEAANRTEGKARTQSTNDTREVRAEVKVKYRDPVTNETWSGRGRMASWLKAKQEAGEDIEKYLV